MKLYILIKKTVLKKETYLVFYLFLLSFTTFSQTIVLERPLTINGHWTIENTSNDLCISASFDIDYDNSIRGIINWSIVKVDPSVYNYYRTRMNATAKEYVKGNYNPTTRTIKLYGYAKDDPSQIIMLSDYKIELTGENKVTGKSREKDGIWDGVIRGSYTMINNTNYAASNSVDNVSKKNNNSSANNSLSKLQDNNKDKSNIAQDDVSYYQDLFDQYLYQYFKGEHKDEYKRHSISNVKIVSKGANGKATKVHANYIFSNSWYNGYTGSVEVLFDENLAYCMYFDNDPSSCTTPKANDANTQTNSDNKRIKELQHKYGIDWGKSHLNTMSNSKEYTLSEILMIQKKYDAKLDMKNYLTKAQNHYIVSAVEEYEENGWSPGGTSGQIQEITNTKKRRYDKDMEEPGLKNTASHAILIRGIKKKRNDIDGSIYYMDASITIGPLKTIKYIDIESNYNDKIAEVNSIHYYSGTGTLTKIASEKNATIYTEKSDPYAKQLYYKGKEYSDVGNHTEALKYYMQACDRNYAPALHVVGYMYGTGNGVSRNYQEAMKFYQKAAEQGYARSQLNIGMLYWDGHGVIQDYDECYKWLMKAAIQGEETAQTNIGVLYENGFGVIQSIQEAIKWYKKGAENGDALGQYNLGIAYTYGRGIETNINLGGQWIIKAAKQGNKAAKDYCITNFGIFFNSN